MSGVVFNKIREHYNVVVPHSVLDSYEYDNVKFEDLFANWLHEHNKNMTIVNVEWFEDYFSVECIAYINQ